MLDLWSKYAYDRGENMHREVMALSIIPWVVKNSYNSNAGIDSIREKEVRILYCPYDVAEFNGGRVEYNIYGDIFYKTIVGILDVMQEMNKSVRNYLKRMKEKLQF